MQVEQESMGWALKFFGTNRFSTMFESLKFSPKLNEVGGRGMDRVSSYPCVKGSLLGLLLLLLVPASNSPITRGQNQQQKSTTTQEKAGEEEAEDIERQKQEALQILYQASESVKDIADVVLRIRASATVAEALWQYDQPLARQLFQAAFSATKDAPRDESGPPPGARSWASIGSTRTPQALRREILEKVAKLDPTLATDLARSIETEKEVQQTPSVPKGEKPLAARSVERTRGSERAQTLLGLANSLLEQDPKQAADAAAAILSEGIPQPFIQFLMRLRQKDRALADALFDKALRAVFRNNPPLLSELLVLGSYVHQDLQLPIRHSIGGPTPPVNPAQVASYLNALIEAIGMAAQAVSNPAVAPAVIERDLYARPQMLRAILINIRPHVTEFIPNHLVTLDALIGQLSVNLPPEQPHLPPAESQRTLPPEERLNELLQRAERATPEEHDELLFQAVRAAVGEGRWDLALATVPKINDLRLRTELSDYVHYSRVQRAIRDEDLETARQSARELNNPERFTLAFISIARWLAEQKEKDQALAALQEAEAKIKRLPTSAEKARSLLQIAEATLSLDTERTFDSLGAVVDVLNRSDAEIETNKAGNFVFAFTNTAVAMEISQGNLIPVIERLIGALTRADAARAFSLIASFEKLPLRVIASVAYARSRLQYLKEKAVVQGKKKSNG